MSITPKETWRPSAVTAHFRAQPSATTRLCNFSFSLTLRGMFSEQIIYFKEFLCQSTDSYSWPPISPHSFLTGALDCLEPVWNGLKRRCLLSHIIGRLQVEWPLKAVLSAAQGDIRDLCSCHLPSMASFWQQLHRRAVVECVHWQWGPLLPCSHWCVGVLPSGLTG